MQDHACYYLFKVILIYNYDCMYMYTVCGEGSFIMYVDITWCHQFSLSTFMRVPRSGSVPRLAQEALLLTQPFYCPILYYTNFPTCAELRALVILADGLLTSCLRIDEVFFLFIFWQGVCWEPASTKIPLPFARVGALEFRNISKEYEDVKIIRQKNIQ